MTTPTIDLRSDAVTRPTPAMRRVMADAEVGDDLLDGDPTVRRLEAHVAEMLGKERALFFPTGTMANQTALWFLGRRGSEIVVDAASHVIDWEWAGAAALAGVHAHAVQPRHGREVMDPDALADALLSRGPRASLVCLENTHNAGGGSVLTSAQTAAFTAHARTHALPIHLDGARLWNAAIATGESEAALAAPADTVMVSFSKGLGAPVGAALVGSAAAMRDAWDVRKRFGGGMRQSGIVAAGALHGLAHHRDRLADDHGRARDLAARIGDAGGARVVAPQTNIVMIDLPSPNAAAVAAHTASLGVRVNAWSRSRVRLVTHLDIDDAAIAQAADVLVRTLETSRHTPLDATAQVSYRR